MWADGSIYGSVNHFTIFYGPTPTGRWCVSDRWRAPRCPSLSWTLVSSKTPETNPSAKQTSSGTLLLVHETRGCMVQVKIRLPPVSRWKK